MSSKLVLALSAVALLVSPAAALAAPQAGVYHGVVNGSVAGPCGNEGEGFFRLRANGRVAPAGNFQFCGGPASVPKILAPSDFQCNQLNANLSAPSIPVDASGAFARTENDPIGPAGAMRTVTFRGSWVTDTKVTGITRIRGDGCDRLVHWRMKVV